MKGRGKTLRYKNKSTKARQGKIGTRIEQTDEQEATMQFERWPVASTTADSEIGRQAAAAKKTKAGCTRDGITLESKTS